MKLRGKTRALMATENIDRGNLEGIPDRNQPPEISKMRRERNHGNAGRRLKCSTAGVRPEFVFGLPRMRVSPLSRDTNTFYSDRGKCCWSSMLFACVCGGAPSRFGRWSLFRFWLECWFWVTFNSFAPVAPSFSIEGRVYLPAH